MSGGRMWRGKEAWHDADSPDDHRRALPEGGGRGVVDTAGIDLVPEEQVDRHLKANPGVGVMAMKHEDA